MIFKLPPMPHDRAIKPARLRLPPLLLRICLPGQAEPHELLPRAKRRLCRWELFDDANEIVAVNAWYVIDNSVKSATLTTLLQALDMLARLCITCPRLTVQFPEIDPKTHDTAFTMLRRRPHPTWNRAFETYLAV